MPKYREKLIDYLKDIEKDLCQDCQRRVETNPIRVLDCKVESCQTKLVEAPSITDNLCSSCNSDFSKLKELLEQNSIPFTVNKRLVRGLDYYNKSAFEFVSSEVGSQNAIAGGGRYDSLVEYLGGKSTPAVGFAIGVERVLPLIDMESDSMDGYYFGVKQDSGVEKILSIAKD